jgi:hypothetical protein
MASVVLSGDTSGSITVAAPAVAGSNTQTLVATTGTLAPIVSGTAVASTSGTSIDFTSIPSWVKRITVMFQGVSTSGTSNIQIQLGTSSGFTTTGYLGSTAVVGSSPTVQSFTAGFDMYGAMTAATAAYGAITFSLIGSNAWVANGIIATSLVGANSISGTKTLAGTLDMVRITTVSGTDTFDANGGVNILYE